MARLNELIEDGHHVRVGGSPRQPHVGLDEVGELPDPQFRVRCPWIVATLQEERLLLHPDAAAQLGPVDREVAQGRQAVGDILRGQHALHGHVALVAEPGEVVAVQVQPQLRDDRCAQVLVIAVQTAPDPLGLGVFDDNRRGAFVSRDPSRAALCVRGICDLWGDLARRPS